MMKTRHLPTLHWIHYKTSGQSDASVYDKLEIEHQHLLVFQSQTRLLKYHPVDSNFLIFGEGPSLNTTMGTFFDLTSLL